MAYPSFAEKAAKASTSNIKQIASELVTETEPHINQWLEKIRYFAEQSNSIEELQARLVAEFDNLSEDELVEAMATAFATANLQGRNEVNDGH